jgi:hypothetical protein
MNSRKLIQIVALCALAWSTARAQSAAELAALKGLAPVTILSKTDEGKAALSANYIVTGGIETGDVRQPTLLPFPEQQRQALRDAFMTESNLAELADGLGTTLGSAYLARYHNIDQKHTSRMPQSIADLIHYATSISGPQSNMGKYLFANGTTDGKIPVSPEALEIVTSIGGSEDVFGKAYGLPAGTANANPYGDSRPFQTEKKFVQYVGKDYFNRPAGNIVFNYGPAMDLTDSPSYPSGHTTYGYTGAVLLAILVPERYAQMVVRGAEYGNDRILVGSHYAMDVMGGRTLALYDLAHLLANDPAYMGLSIRGATPIKDFRDAVRKARAELLSVLQSGCGNTVEACASEDTGRFSSPAANEAFYAVTQTYDLPVVYPKNAGVIEDVAKIAPEAGNLLTMAFPSLTLEQADRILTETEGPGGGFLDDGSAFGVYSRLNLYAASQRAAQVSAGK